MASYLRHKGGNKARVGKLSRVAGQKQTLQGIGGRTNFPKNNSRSFAVVKSWEFMEF